MQTTLARSGRLVAHLMPLATCLSASLCNAGASTYGQAAKRLPTTQSVTNCLDDGSGTLRAAVATAQPGDTIDLGGLPLACGGTATSDVTIVLSSGEIAIDQDNLTLKGPDRGSVTISGNHASRVLNHTGAGALTINHLRIADGKVSNAGFGAGGCVSSANDIVVQNSRITGCELSGFYVEGGGLAADGAITLVSSTVSDNKATTTGMANWNEHTPLGFANAEGGGLSSWGLTALYSTVSNNSAGGPGSVSGGGISVVWGTGSTIILDTTIDHNQAIGGRGGGLVAFATPNMVIANCTISNNSALEGALALYDSTNSVPFAIVNSTIVSNHSSDATKGAGIVLGIDVAAGTGVPSFFLESSIVALNTAGANNAPSDLFSYQPLAGAALTGSHNIVGQITGGLTPPSGFATSVNPRLGPLSHNGGLTQTHALLAGSPAIGTGSNVSFFTANDQRGIGYPRSTTTSTGMTTDIGAYEYDSIFADDLEVHWLSAQRAQKPSQHTVGQATSSSKSPTLACALRPCAREDRASPAPA